MRRALIYSLLSLLASLPHCFMFGLGGKIRTSGNSDPNRGLYQTELHPDSLDFRVRVSNKAATRPSDSRSKWLVLPVILPWEWFHIPRRVWHVWSRCSLEIFDPLDKHLVYFDWYCNCVFLHSISCLGLLWRTPEAIRECTFDSVSRIPAAASQLIH